MLLASLLYSINAFGLTDLGKELVTDIAGLDAGSLAIELREMRSRLLWVTMVLLFDFCALAAIAVAWRTMRQSLSPRTFWVFATIGIGLTLLSVAMLLMAARTEDPIWAIYALTQNWIDESGHFTSAEATISRVTVTVLNAFAVFVPLWLILAASSIFAQPPATQDSVIRGLSEQMRRLRWILNASAALMAAGVLHMLCWMRRPAAMLPDPVAGELEELAAATSMYWGMSYFLVILAFYLPCTHVLVRGGRAAVQRNPAVLGDLGADEWLDQHGFSMSPAKHLPQVAVMLVPLITGPVGAALAGLPDAFG